MRKFFLSVFLIFTLTQSFSQNEGLLEFSKSYFRANPFEGKFSLFLKKLIQDPNISSKVIRHQTDTSLFFFSGVYTTYNPFFFKPVRVEVLLQQSRIAFVDSLEADTIFTYQLRGYADKTEKGEAEVKKEMAKIHRQYVKKFFDSNSQDLNIPGTIGIVTNYFVPFSGLSPLSVFWTNSQNKDDPLLCLVLRFKMSENEAVLAAPLNNP